MSTIQMQCRAELSRLRRSQWSVGIIGQPVDDRGEAAIEFVKDTCKDTTAIAYDPADLEVELRGKWPADDIEDALSALGGGTILVEGTTVGVAELFLVCKAAKAMGNANLTILYAEPAQYRTPHRNQVLKKRDFDLSDVVRNFTGLPGAAMIVREQSTRAVMLVGYEGARLEQALEQSGVSANRCSIVFGVPAFRPGWEMDSFANNIRVVRENGVQEVSFAGAQSPVAAYGVLRRLLDSCENGERLMVCPIGTKPHAIGAAVFACDNPEVGLVYDHPVRSQGRTQAVGLWHMYQVEFSDV